MLSKFVAKKSLLPYAVTLYVDAKSALRSLILFFLEYGSCKEGFVARLRWLNYWLL